MASRVESRWRLRGLSPDGSGEYVEMAAAVPGESRRRRASARRWGPAGSKAAAAQSRWRRAIAWRWEKVGLKCKGNCR